MKNKEMRAFEFEVRAQENEERGNFLDGRPIVYNQRTDMGWYIEVIESGALNDTDLRDVRFLVNHNTDMIPLARSRNNNANSTMQLMPDDEGMNIRVSLDTEGNAEAKSLYSACKRGDISGMSFMFTVDEDRWEDLMGDKPTRHITKLAKVFEVSAVTWPAYEQTTLEARSEALESAKNTLESARAEYMATQEARAKRIKALKLKCEVYANGQN